MSNFRMFLKQLLMRMTFKHCDYFRKRYYIFGILASGHAAEIAAITFKGHSRWSTMARLDRSYKDDCFTVTECVSRVISVVWLDIFRQLLLFHTRLHLTPSMRHSTARWRILYMYWSSAMWQYLVFYSLWYVTTVNIIIMATTISQISYTVLATGIHVTNTNLWRTIVL